MRYIIIFLMCTMAFGCSTKESKYVEDKGKIFNTSYTIKYQYTQSLKEEIDAELLHFDNSLNVFKATSVISRVNNNEVVELDSFFINVFNRSQQISEASDGLFDITISSLINAWGFGFKNIDNLTSDKIDSLKQLVGYKKIKLEGGIITKLMPDIQINASAIAKGYAVDVVGHLLESHGIENYMVEIGGEIRAKGMSQRGRCWNVAVSMPLGEDIFNTSQSQIVVKLCNKAMATSGNYRNYYMKDGKKYAHTINPATGRPSEKSTLSATVIASDCMTADAYATAFMLADTLTIKRMAEKEAIDYLLVIAEKDNSHTIIKSDNFHEYEH